MLYQDEEKFDNRALFDLPDKSIRRSNGYKLNLSKFRVKNKTHFQQWKYIYLLGLLAKDWFSDIWSFKILFGDLLFILLDFFCLCCFLGVFSPKKREEPNRGASGAAWVVQKTIQNHLSPLVLFLNSTCTWLMPSFTLLAMVRLLSLKYYIYLYEKDCWLLSSVSWVQVSPQVLEKMCRSQAQASQ